MRSQSHCMTSWACVSLMLYRLKFIVIGCLDVDYAACLNKYVLVLQDCKACLLNLPLLSLLPLLLIMLLSICIGSWSCCYHLVFVYGYYVLGLVRHDECNEIERMKWKWRNEGNELNWKWNEEWMNW